MYVLESIIESDGINLSSVGINGHAFRAEAALQVIEILKEASVKILGGDVLKAEKSDYTLTYDNWYYEGFDVQESCDKAINYIMDFRERNGDEFVYQLITG